MLSILEFIFIATSHKHYAFTITYVRFGNLSLFGSCVMLRRPKKAETAALGYEHTSSLFFMVDLGIKPATNVAIVSIIVASS